MRKISQKVKDQVVEVSLRHPDCGARRLVPLLNGEDIFISASSVYNILRGCGLQTRSLRLVQLAKRQAAADRPLIRKPAGISNKVLAITVSPRISAKTKEYPNPTTKRPRFFHVLNVLLLLAIGCLGDQLLQSGGQNGWEADAAVFASAPARVAADPDDNVRPLAKYSGIGERNLTGTSEPVPPVAAKRIPPDKITAVESDLGMTLIGTAVVDDPTMSMAVIDNRSSRAKKVYHEGDRVGEGWIKKILRNKVLIATARGDALLAANLPSFGQSFQATSAAQQKAANRALIINGESPGSLPVEQDSPFVDIDALMSQVQISPYLEDDQAAGVRVSAIGSPSPLTRLRLRNGDVITGVNGEKISGPAEATRFFEQLAEGGDITLQVIRRRRPKLIHLNIN
jgi:type II secretion system protein C